MSSFKEHWYESLFTQDMAQSGRLLWGSVESVISVYWFVKVFQGVLFVKSFQSSYSRSLIVLCIGSVDSSGWPFGGCLLASLNKTLISIWTSVNWVALECGVDNRHGGAKCGTGQCLNLPLQCSFMASLEGVEIGVCCLTLLDNLYSISHVASYEPLAA